NRDGGLWRNEDSANREFQMQGEDGSLDNDAIPDFPAILLRKFTVHHAPSLVALPSGQLVVWDLEVRIHLKDLRGIGAKLREEILGLIVFVQSAKPLRRSYRHDSGHGAHFFPV